MARPSCPCARAVRSSSPATARSRMGNTVIKSNARKVRRLADGAVIAGFAGATADAFTLFERLEGKLEQYPRPADARLRRTGQGLAHRPLPAPPGGDDGGGRRAVSLVLSGTGDVLEPEDGLIGIGSGGPYALAAARAHDRPRRPERRGDRPPGADHRRRHLRLHQRHIVIDRDAYEPASPRAKSSPNSTATSSARTTPSAPSPSRCAIAGAGSSLPRRCARRCCRRTS